MGERRSRLLQLLSVLVELKWTQGDEQKAQCTNVNGAASQPARLLRTLTTLDPLPPPAFPTLSALRTSLLELLLNGLLKSWLLKLLIMTMTMMMTEASGFISELRHFRGLLDLPHLRYFFNTLCFKPFNLLFYFIFIRFV